MSFTTSFARQNIPQLKKYINVSNRRYSSSSSSLLLTTSRPAYSGSTNSFIRKSSSSSPFTNHGSLISRSTTFSSLPFFSHIIRQSFHNKLSKHRSIIRTFKPNSKPRKFLETSSNLEPIASAHLLNFLERPFTSQNPFLLTHGASGIAKHTDQLVSTPNNGKYFSVGCGEDAFFRRHDALGVADGVGGWRNVTPSRNAVPDSALYSRKLMHYAYAELEKYDNNRDEERLYHYNEVYPQDILQTSYEQCIRDCAMEGIIGSSTALIAILREDELRIANL
ncbi:3062_t:CDS:2, partial [Acaulospora morrowiae]